MRGLDRIRYHRLELPLRRPFGTASGRTVSRSVILVSVESGGLIGLGEAAPFPGHSRDDIDRAWDSLIAAGPAAVAGESPATLSLTSAAALDQALTDLAARRAGQPMWQFLGGASPRAAAGWVAAATDLDATIALVGAGDAAGHRAVKVKIAPGHPGQTLRVVKEAFPDMAIGADANGSFGKATRSELDAVDAMGLTYLEQPIGAHAERELATFASASKTPVALDESVPDAPAITRVCVSRLAPIVVVKAGHLGTTGAAEAISQIAAAGLSARIGGLVETTVGRNHALALATLLSGSGAGASLAGDLAAGSPYFVAEPASLPLVLDAGDAVAASRPGIGVELNMDVVQRFTVDHATFR